MTAIEDVVGEFHKATDIAKAIEISSPRDRAALVTLRRTLIEEEVKELIDEIEFLLDGRGSARNLAKEMADVLYVVAGTADLLDIPLQRVFEAVHASNMSKIPVDGQVLRREDGKILKPETYREADLSFLPEEVSA